MAQITTQMSRGPTLRVVSGDYTGIPLSLRRRLSLRLIIDGIDITPKPLLYDTEELSEYIQEGIQPSAATHHTSDIPGTTSSSMHVTKRTPVELTSTQEPVTESEMKNFVLVDDSKTSEVSGEIPHLPLNLLYRFPPQEPKVPESSLPPRNVLITLKETPTIFHLTLPALNLDVETDESEAVESDNKYYEYVTIGKGRHRNTKTAEVQTEYSFRKTRSTMTTAVGIKDSSASANAWDLYHSYRKLENIENVEFKHIQGASPELVLLDMHDKELERIDLAALSRQDCNDLLNKRGFHRKKPDNEMQPNIQHEDF